MNFLEKAILSLAPTWGLRRMRSRSIANLMSRHYEAASRGRRTSNWARSDKDANAVLERDLLELRRHARDLVRNNAYAARAVEVITGNTVGWGIAPKPRSSAVASLWKAWAESTQCDATGKLTFAGLQELALRTIVESGEVLIRRRGRLPSDGLVIPLQLEVLEPDFLDSSRDEATSQAGGPIIQGIEFDMIGRRAAYWIFPKHPGSNRAASESRRIPASDILHVFRALRPGQVRGVTWLAQIILTLKEFDLYEDATLKRQQIAAMLAAFVTDLDGAASPIAEASDDDSIETFEPGTIQYLTPGKQITFSNPPTTPADDYAVRNLRKIAAGMGITYEDLTEDYSNVNFSSARMARLAHWQNVYKWRHNLLIPQMCTEIWQWAMEAALIDGEPDPEWAGPAMPMIEPDKEGLAYQRLVRTGVMTYSQMVAEQGGDPASHWKQYAEDQKMLDALGIKLDSDVRAVSQAGLTQERAGGSPAPTTSDE